MPTEILFEDFDLDEGIKMEDASVQNDIHFTDAEIASDVVIEGLGILEQAEVDPTVPSHVKNITTNEIDDWNSYREITNLEVEAMFDA